MLLGKDGDYAGNADDFVNLIGQFGRLIGNDIGGFVLLLLHYFAIKNRVLL